MILPTRGVTIRISLTMPTTGKIKKRVGPVSKAKSKKKESNRRRWDSVNRPRIDKTTIYDTLTLEEYKKHRT